MSDKLRILVVDDSAIVRKAFLKVLGSEYELAEAEDGQTAWDMLNQDDDICAVFADMEMSGLDGRELLERVRVSENEDIKVLPFILMATDRDNQTSKLEALEAGVTDFISKPFDSVFLKACARTHVHPNSKMLGYDRSSILDPLTKLANRTFLFKRGVQEISLATRNRSYLSLILITLKGFDAVQEAYGEKVSKGMLRIIASSIAAEVRLEDTVARVGKDLFAVLISGVDEKGVDIVAVRFLGVINNKNIRYGDMNFEVGLNMGAIVMKPEVFQPFEIMYEMAEESLAQAVAEGSGRLVKRVLTAVEKQEQRPATQMMSLDTAAFLIKHRQHGQLNGVEEYLLDAIFPILEYCNAKLQLDLDAVLAKLRQRLSPH